MAYERWSERAQHHFRHRRWMVVLVVLASILSCDPTGNMNPAVSGGGGGVGDPNDIDPEMVGSWKNVHVEGEIGDPNLTRVTTTWHFSSSAACSRSTESYSLVEDLTRTTLRNCGWLADGRVLVVLYEGASDTVSYIYGFPNMRHDTLEIGGFRFANVGP